MPKSKKRQTAKKQAYSPAVTGVLDIARSGLGYVSVTGMTQDIIVRRENLKNAMQGDTVEVSIYNVSHRTRRAEGVIVKVVKRGQSELIGTVQKNKLIAFVIPDNPSFNRDVFLGEAEAAKVKDGDRVIVRIVRWNEKMKNPDGQVTDILTEERSNEIAMKEILLQQGFNLEFPADVIAESEAIPDVLPEEEIARRRDMRDTLTITIDPHDAKDFDDAISLKTLPNGHYEIGIHIADVSYYVKPGSALDREAYQRATSVYLPDRVLPMLPEKISNGLCSLRPLEDKFTFSVVVEMNTKAEVQSYWMGRTVIHSNHRFAYEEAQAIIEGGEHEHRDTILTLHGLSQQLRERKFKAGAINFSSEESRFVLDEYGVPTDVMIKENNASHQLIEELMLLANRMVALDVSKVRIGKEHIPFPYRVHDTPDIDKLKQFAQFAAHFGHRFDFSSPQKISASFNAMIAKTGTHPGDAILHTLGIRTMAKAVYQSDNIGHYGLAFEHYCHFTSPIRRYPDVMVHRILAQCLAGHAEADSNMDEKCRHCSERERKAMEAEREGNKYKQVEFMRKHIGEEFDAVISGVAAFGFWATTSLQRCEGFVSVFHLQDRDQFEFVEDEYALVGRRTKKVYQIGQTVRIKVAGANLIKRQIDFELAE
ncbi:MAG: ribonuclease R [Chitinophagaceae bacterium]